MEGCRARKRIRADVDNSKGPCARPNTTPGGFTMISRKLRIPALLMALLLLCTAAIPALAESTADKVAHSAAGIGNEAASIWQNLYSFYSGNATALYVLIAMAVVGLILMLVFLFKKRRILALLLAIVMVVAAAWGIPAVFAGKETTYPDTDGDGLTDQGETVYGTDPTLPDTDSDGLTDYEEVLAGMNPLQADSDGDGVNDSETDADGDGLTYAQETELGTDPFCADTDSDRLSDSEEINLYGTDPLKKDTDGDGASDGLEVEQGTDPLTKQQTFHVVKTVENVQDAAPSVEVTLNGKQADTLTISPAAAPQLSADIPGAMSQAYDFSVAGEFESATVSFTFDKSELPAGSEVVIAQYNEETQELELLDTTVSGDTAYCEVTELSTYILLNKTAFDEVWDTEIKPPVATEGASVKPEELTLDIVFVIDSSGSMDRNDPNFLCMQVTRKFISKLRSGIDRAALLRFDVEAVLLCGLTYDTSAIDASLNYIYYDGNYTNGSDGIHDALELLDGSTARFKYIVFLTDGCDNLYYYYYDDLIAQANNMGVNIYTIGMGSASESVLKDVAARTGGKYYYATTSTASEGTVVLDEAFDSIEEETIDYSADSNGDGISDYYTRKLTSGELRLGTGEMNPFFVKGITYEQIQAGGEDLDGDTIPNGEELVVVHNESTGRVYVQLKSNPALADSDGDGYADNQDARPLTWDVSDRDLAIASVISYLDLDPGMRLDALPMNLDSYAAKKLTGEDGVAIASVKELTGWYVVDELNQESAHAFALKKDDNMILVFRGTQPPIWNTLFDTWEHADGVWDALEDSHSNDEDFIKNWTNNLSTIFFGVSTHAPACQNFTTYMMSAYPDCTFYFTGHSLGGNLAYKSAARALNIRPRAVANVVTFNGLGLSTVGNFVPSFITNYLFEDVEHDRNDVEDARTLTRYKGIICDYRIEKDFVTSGMATLFSTHFGEDKVYPLQPQADGRHSVLNFFPFTGLEKRHLSVGSSVK